MNFLKRAAMAAMTMATLAAGPAYAAPVVQAPLASDGLVVQVRGCHRDVQRHRVPEFGRRAWHFHRGRRCRPIEVDSPRPEPIRDCHREPRRHFVPELGRSAVHRHRGPGCRVQVLRRYDRPRPGGTCVNIEGFSFCVD